MDDQSAASRRVMIIAGEASGDQHGAGLVRAMKQRCSGLEFFGIGGRKMKDAGVDIRVNAEELSVVGITEVFAKIPSLLRGVSSAKAMLKDPPPDLLILIDFPDFNLHIAGHAKKAGVPVLYYISPQIWAWRKGRVRKIKKRVDHMAVILPFEERFYAENGVPVTYVGHPLADVYPVLPPEEADDPGKEDLVIGLLPGSREKEVIRMLPVMLDAVERLEQHVGRFSVKISVAPTVPMQTVEKLTDSRTLRSDWELVGDSVQRIFKESTLLVATSGTVTLDAAFFATPMIIVYRISGFSYWMARSLVDVPHIGLVNLIAGERIVPELIQNEATGDTIADGVLDMVGSGGGLQTMRKRLLTVRNTLAKPGASARVAGIAMELLERRGQKRSAC